MARAAAASASAHPDSIRGLAQSVAKPAYRRLLNAEPLLRRAVPVLIIAFLVTICVGALVQVLDHRRQTLIDDVISLEAVADLAAERLQQPLKKPGDAVGEPQQVLARVLPSWAMAAGRRFVLTNAEGVVTAATPATDATIGRRLIDLLGPTPVDDLRRQCGGHGHHLTQRDASPGNCTNAQCPVRATGSRSISRRRTRRMAITYDADDNFICHHRFCGAHSRLRIPLASHSGAGSGPNLRNGPQPHRYRAQPGPLRTMGLGPRTRSYFLVSVNVRNPRSRRQRRSALLWRSE